MRGMCFVLTMTMQGFVNTKYAIFAAHPEGHFQLK